MAILPAISAQAAGPEEPVTLLRHRTGQPQPDGLAPQVKRSMATAVVRFTLAARGRHFWQDDRVQEAMSPMVQVVTITDWPAVVTGIATGAVGLAGIVATYWQGKRATEAASENLQTSIKAETERARLAEKRRIYAACEATFSEMIQTVAWHRAAYRERDETALSDAVAQLQKLDHAMYLALAEVRLIGSPDVTRVASDVINALLDFDEATLDGEFAATEDGAELSMGPVSKLRAKLFDAMRTDLAEPTLKAS